MKGLEYKHKIQTNKISIRIYDKNSREITKRNIRRKTTIWRIKFYQLTARRK